MKAPAFASLKDAEAVAGPLGEPSKMPGYAYGLPAWRCPVGSVLRGVPGSVCSGCYALKGRYTFPNVKGTLERRFDSLTDPRWVDAMVYMIKYRECDYFRWHDSGDIQGMWHLEKIVEVAKRCRKTKFWIPTRENQVVKQYLAKHGKFPRNLVVRVSGAMMDGPPPQGFRNTSTVLSEIFNPTCPARFQDGKCGDCRACWNPRVRNVSYPKH